jgi:hypothetical protein
MVSCRKACSPMAISIVCASERRCSVRAGQMVFIFAQAIAQITRFVPVGSSYNQTLIAAPIMRRVW